jgi:hypothetical protein
MHGDGAGIDGGGITDHITCRIRTDNHPGTGQLEPKRL